MAHWKHTATRCAVEGCDRTRKKGWSTCELSAHYDLGQSLYGAGKIAPIPNPERRWTKVGSNEPAEMRTRRERQPIAPGSGKVKP